MILEVKNIKSLIKEKKEGITFFIPCLNEKNTIVDTLIAIKSAIESRDIDYEILIFDDKSYDNSRNVLKKFIKKKKIKIFFNTNKKTNFEF